jgi:hypothetical protein
VCDSDKFLMLYPDDMDLESRRAVFLMKIHCWYMLCSALTFIGRDEGRIEAQVRIFMVMLTCQKACYEAAAKHALQFRMQMKSLDSPLEEAAKRNLKSKHSFVLLLAFEAAVKIKDWISTKSVIQVSL